MEENDITKQRFIKKCGELLADADETIASAEYHKAKDLLTDEYKDFSVDSRYEYAVIQMINGDKHIVNITEMDFSAIATILFISSQNFKKITNMKGVQNVK